MNRRGFLKGIAALPAAPLLPLLPAAAAQGAAILMPTGGVLEDVLLGAVDRIVNPPWIYDSNPRSSESVFQTMYRDEFIKTFEQNISLLRKVSR